MKKSFLSILLLTYVFVGKAQTGLGLWSGIGLEKKINKKFAVNVSTQTRFVENIAYLQTYFGEASLEYKINKHFDVLGAYRFINRRKNDLSNFKNRHRFYADFSYNNRIKKIKLDNRIRYQHQFKDNDGEIGFDRSYIRNKLEIAYANKSKFSPYISGDLFYEIGGNINQIRPKAGVNYKINKKNSVDASAFTNIDLIGVIPARPIIGLVYKLKL